MQSATSIPQTTTPFRPTSDTDRRGEGRPGNSGGGSLGLEGRLYRRFAIVRGDDTVCGGCRARQDGERDGGGDHEEYGRDAERASVTGCLGDARSGLCERVASGCRNGQQDGQAKGSADLAGAG